MRTVGYITDGKGRRVLALVPVTQLRSMATGRSESLAALLTDEQAALDRLFTCPSACLETSTQVNPIRSAREAAGLTQADLAFALRISQPMLSRQEQPFRRVRPATIRRALEAIQRIQENQNRPEVSLDGVLSRYGARLEASAARKPRDPVERRLLQEAGDSVALLESDANFRDGGERRRPPRKKAK
jgi:transcriptional regulator with XRE-family HTH domain